MRDSNVYYNAESHGLEVVAEEDFGGSYEFDTHVVWKHKDGRHFYAHDSGCSCPTPFEDYASVDELRLVTLENVGELQKELSELEMGEFFIKVLQSLHGAK